MLFMPAMPPELPSCYVMTGAQVWVDDSRRAEARPGYAVVVQGERIVAVGPEAKTLKAWPKARRVSLPGGMLLPGFIEGHAHVEGIGLMRRNLNLIGAASVQEVEARLKPWSAGNPTGWIVGRGWDQNLWSTKVFPTAKELDAMTGERPAALRRVDGHAVWVNSVALALAGITDQTPDPPGGRILRNKGGHATGILLDTAGDLVRLCIPPPTPAERQSAIREGLNELMRQGFTSVADMGCDASYLAAYRELARKDDLPIRVFAYLEGAPAFLKQELAGPRSLQTSFFQVQGVKVYLDGALGSRGARLLKPYADEPGSQGIWVQDPKEVQADLDRTLAAGYQPAVHVIGDAANRALLELVRHSSLAKTSALKVRAEHAQIVTLRDARRFGEAGLIASVQPIHLSDDHAWTPTRLGLARTEEAFPWRTFLQGGATLCFGSDAPISDSNPFPGMAVGESREDGNGQPHGGFNPTQKLTRTETIRAYTLGNAQALGSKELGHIQSGALADLLWVQAPLQALTVDELRKVRPARLWVNGKEVHLP